MAVLVAEQSLGENHTGWSEQMYKVGLEHLQQLQDQACLSAIGVVFN